MFEAPRPVESAAAGRDNTGLGPSPLAQMDFHRILLLVRRGKKTIFWTTAASLLLMAVFILVVPHRYTATTQILIDPTDLRAVGSELSPTNQMSDVAVLQVESQVRVLTSDSVLRRVIKTEALDRDAEFAGRPSLLRGLIGAVGLGGAAPADSTLTALTALRRSLVVKRAERTYVVDVSVTSLYPEKAERIANAIAQAYLAEQTDVRSDAARQISQTLSARLNELKDRVREAEERVEAFKARNNILGASGQLVNEQQLSELNNQLGATRARAAQAKARLEEVERLQRIKGDVGAVPEAVQSPTITALRGQYAEIVRREAEQMTSLGARHPAVIEIQAQADRLRRMIEEEVNRTALSARSEYESAHANEDMLARSLEALKHNAVVTNEAMVTLRELERDVQASRAVYEAFLVRARETGEQERLDTKNIRVISRADLPLHRSFPPSNLILAVAALALGIGAGIAITILRPPGDETAARPDVGRSLGGRPDKVAAGSKPARPARPDVPVLAVLLGADEPPELWALSEPKSRFARDIRKIYEAVRTSHNKSGNPSLLVVATRSEDDDTAVVALNLAAVGALTQRVLLIDADLDQRMLTAVDAEQSEAGLVDVAVGRRVLSDVVVRDRETNINLLPFVAPNSRRDRRIKDEDIKLAFAQTKHFDMVIIAAADSDGDPSGRFFAGLVDHIVLVARTEDADAGAIEELVLRFGLDARKIRGAVLTSAEAA
ncbi:MAG: exopolysaccharide transport family protein [Xanthobacteraceae bacterium]